jgi:GNAT superfamily N-acetyltransferase
MSAARIRRLEGADEYAIAGLCDVLIDCVEGGDSIGFMWPMTREKADRYWRSAAASAQQGERVILLAEDDSGIVGTVSIIWAPMENQPHRADIAKMQVHRRARRRGIGALLLRAAESIALENGRTVLVLDTASPDAERLYRRSGWQECGAIPNYALMPDGAYCDTIVFYKLLRKARDPGRAPRIKLSCRMVL